MTLIRYQPWDMFNQVREDMSRLLETHFGDLRDSDNSRVITSQWTPAIDIREEPNQFVIYADVPGVKVEDIEVTMENGVLTVKGERKFEKEHEKNGYRRVERATGSFYRRFSLPDSANAERIEAKTKDGVLEIVIPKQAKTLPRKIAVKG